MIKENIFRLIYCKMEIRKKYCFFSFIEVCCPFRKRHFSVLKIQMKNISWCYFSWSSKWKPTVFCPSFLTMNKNIHSIWKEYWINEHIFDLDPLHSAGLSYLWTEAACDLLCINQNCKKNRLDKRKRWKAMLIEKGCLFGYGLDFFLVSLVDHVPPGICWKKSRLKMFSPSSYGNFAEMAF